MPAISDYNVCISPCDDAFVPSVGAVSRLIDFLDSNLYLDGPDRDDARLVILPARETKEWRHYIRPNSEASVQALRKRYVNLLHSPSAVENYYKHYGELGQQVENISLRETAFVASLGRGTRRLNDLSHYMYNEQRRWLQYVVAHIICGHHALWDRVWDEHSSQKMWELQAVKGFTLMLSCKVNPKVEVPTLEVYMNGLQAKPEFQEFLTKVSRIIGVNGLELIGEHTG